MDLLSSIALPHWLMIAGAIFVVIGILGLLLTRKSQAEDDPESTVPRSQMPPIPKLVDSSERGNKQGLKAK
jgi:hypothetical protein